MLCQSYVEGPAGITSRGGNVFLSAHNILVVKCKMLGTIKRDKVDSECRVFKYRWRLD
jgi:hypothetical protein